MKIKIVIEHEASVDGLKEVWESIKNQLPCGNTIDVEKFVEKLNQKLEEEMLKEHK